MSSRPSGVLPACGRHSPPPLKMVPSREAKSPISRTRQTPSATAAFGPCGIRYCLKSLADREARTPVRVRGIYRGSRFSADLLESAGRQHNPLWLRRLRGTTSRGIVTVAAGLASRVVSRWMALGDYTGAIRFSYKCPTLHQHNTFGKKCPKAVSISLAEKVIG